MKYLIDSNIIIYYLKGDSDIHSFLNSNKLESSISIITYYEVLNFDFTTEEEYAVKLFLKEFEIINLSKKYYL